MGWPRLANTGQVAAARAVVAAGAWVKSKHDMYLITSDNVEVWELKLLFFTHPPED